MSDETFATPLMAAVNPRRPELGKRRIASLSEGLSALYSPALIEVRDGARGDLWEEAASALCAACVQSDPAKTAAARTALERLLKAVSPIANKRRKALAADDLALWYAAGALTS
ncbi:hypothetical protein U8607_21955 [Methylobacterium durans]|uniref:hypothetical protein n=1 Tax=Methylobacterium durans TaxID=2202825 RepID=UPI002AFDE2C6|nr:hypothetical protein [Methylobacterium durans]MEA1834763.1 hypothetical protein [Methylobacterium durans]